METRECAHHVAASKDAEAKPFRMLSLYDSDAASREATHASNLVLRELGESIEADRTSWDVHSLESPALRGRAAVQAARADLIVIALDSDSPSAALREWIGQWQKNRELSTGLLALIPSGESETGGDLADFLYETAVTANMDFICQVKSRA
jgi:hypothetical protein